MKTEKAGSTFFLKKKVIYSFLTYKCAEEGKITVRNLQNGKNQHNIVEAGHITSQLYRISKPFAWWHLQTFVAYQVSEERRA